MALRYHTPCHWTWWMALITALCWHTVMNICTCARSASSRQAIARLESRYRGSLSAKTKSRAAKSGLTSRLYECGRSLHKSPHGLIRTPTMIVVVQMKIAIDELIEWSQDLCVFSRSPLLRTTDRIPSK